MTTAAPDVVERFRAVIARRLGLAFDDSKLGFLAEVLDRRAHASHRDARTYVAGLEAGSGSEDLAATAAELTVPETYFFRNRDQFHALVEVALPALRRAPGPRRTPRVLSAGSATGEEAYTIAILMADALEPRPAAIRAVDINPQVLRRAAAARYSPWALRDTSAEVTRRWFRADGQDFVLDDAIRDAVTFEQRNLADEDAELWAPSSYDIVFCRNVLMYFTPATARAVVARITRALAPGGFLFLGHAETLRGLSQDFHLRHTHGTFYYQRRTADEAVAPSLAREAPSLDAHHLAGLVDAGSSWVDVIRTASERVAALADGRATSGSRPAPAEAPPRWDTARALELVKHERFGDALAVLRDLPPESAGDPDVLLIEAVLLTHGGELAAAEDACARLLALDELNAAAHYALALCRESAGDRAGAVEHDQVAVYLDPTFAMPRLHLGLLARRVGDRDVARRDLGQALDLLRREDSSRVLLFGGGFTRDALIALCRTELIACGGPA